MAENFFSSTGPNLYTLPHNVSFVDELANAIITLFKDDTLGLADLTIYLPNRRSLRHLQNSILRKTEGYPTILPNLIAIGDMSDDDMLLSSALGLGTGVEQKLNPPIPDIIRQALLTKQIMPIAKHLNLLDIHPAEGVALAKTLCLFLDQVQNENCDLKKLKQLAPDELAIHWQKVLTFLNIVGDNWSNILVDEGYTDPVIYRNYQINQLSENLTNNPTTKPIIAAGSTGSNPSTANLLRAISRQPNGAVILPGFDRDVDEKTWEAIAENPTHPQYIMHGLLEHIGASRHEVKQWPLSLDTVKINESNERMQFLKQALRPAQTVPNWRELSFDAHNAFNGLSYVKCPSPREEAGVIALIMRQTLEVQGKTTALVTPDRGLADRVAAELARWGISVDDSAGKPLTATPPAAFIRLVADAVASQLSPVALLSILKHPFASNGKTRIEFLANVRLFEKLALRGQRPEADIDGIKNRIKKIKNESDKNNLLEFLNALEKTLAPLLKLFKEPKVNFHNFITTLIKSSEGLATSPEKNGNKLLWAEHDGIALAKFFKELIQAKGYFDDINPHEAPALLDALLEGRKVTKNYGAHPRLFIWGTLEARLKHADVMILGGLVEGVWPAEINADPWMSRPMKAEMELSAAERRVGQSALDFLGGCGAKEVILTRSEKIDGAPTVPSRWLLRMEALLGNLPHGEMWLNWFQNLDRPENVRPTEPPHPTPPVSARPSEFWVTGVQNWMQNPYSIYAKEILKLKPLDALNANPDSKLRGIVTHEAIETFMKNKKGAFTSDDIDELLEHGKTTFDKYLAHSSVWPFWWPRFEQSAKAFIDIQLARENTYKTVGNEEEGEINLETKAGKITLKAKADRLDLNTSDNSLEIIDYKTGQAPSDRQIMAGFAPQLPLEGLIAQKGGFKNIKAMPVNMLSYWQIKGGKEAIKEIKKFKLDTSAEIEKAEAGLTSLFISFQSQATPYLCHPRPIAIGYDTYDHLARVKEWENEEQANINKGGA